MGKFKTLVTALIFLGGCVALVATQSVVSALLNSYTAAFPTSFGQHVPAFTSSALALMASAGPICFGSLLVSLALAALALKQAKSRESKLYWVTVLGGLNYYVVVMVLCAVTVGFFLLPRVANGT